MPIIKLTNVMKKYRLLILLFICISINKAEAQKFNVSWGDNTRLKFDYEDAVSVDNGKLIVLKFKMNRGTFGIGGQDNGVPVLVLVDKNMETIKENELEISEKNPTFVKFEKYGNNIFYFYEVFSRSDKSTSVYAIKIDPTTLVGSSPSLIGVYSSESRYNQSELTYKLSIDSSKILVFAEGPEKRKENLKFFIGVFDTDLKPKWKREVELPINQKFVSIYDFDLTNDGKVVIAIKHYDKEVSRQTVREGGIKVPSYAYKLMVYQDAGSAAKEMVFNLDNNFIQGTKLTYGNTGNLTVAGLYKKKANGRVTGAFYAQLDLATNSIKNPMMTVFPNDLIEMVDKDGFGSDSQKDPGLSNNFRIEHIINRDNGSVDLIAEFYLLRVTTTTNTGSNGQITSVTTTYTHTYGDIVNTNIDKDGNAIFTRIPKKQISSSGTSQLGFFPMVFGDKLVLLYNDDRDNVDKDLSKKPDAVTNFKRSVFMAATVNAKGVLTRQAIYDHRDEDYVTHPSSIRKIEDNSYLISSNLMKKFKRRTRFGVLKVK